MASLGSLVVSLAVDTARFQGDLGRAAAIAESRMRNIKDTASKALGAVAVVASAAGTALVASLKAATDRADEFTKLAAGAGVTVEQFSRLAYAAQLSGVETTNLQKALAKLAQDGAQDAYGDLLKLADAIADMPNGTAKTAKAVELFGERIGPQLIPLLNSGRAGIEALAKESDALGNTITTSAGRAAEQFNDNLTRLHTVVGGLGNTLAAEMLPSLAGFSDYVVAAAKNGDTFRTSVAAIGNTLRGLVTAVDFVVTGFVGLGRTIGATMAALVAAAKGNFSEAWDIISARNADAEAEAKGFADRYVALWDGAAVQLAEKIVPPVRNITKEMETAAAKLAALTEKNRANLADFYRQIGERAKASLTEAGSTVGDYWQEESDRVIELNERNREYTRESLNKMTVYAEQAARNMQDALAKFLFDPFKGGVRGMLSSFVDALRQMVAQAAAAKIFEALGFGKGSGGVLGSFGKLLGFADGGSPPVGLPSLVGERGPELFVPRTAGTIVPNNQLGGRTINYSPVYNITSGVTRQELLPALEATRRQSVADMTRLINGGAFAG